MKELLNALNRLPIDSRIELRKSNRPKNSTIVRFATSSLDKPLLNTDTIYTNEFISDTKAFSFAIKNQIENHLLLWKRSN